MQCLSNRNWASVGHPVLEPLSDWLTGSFSWAATCSRKLPLRTHDPRCSYQSRVCAL